MNFLYLDYFKTVAKLENMSKAAEILHVSQPALSKAITKLEETLGISLFYRKRGKITLTYGGHLYYECVERAFLELEKGDHLLAGLKNDTDKAVTIASSLGEVLAAIAQSFLAYEKDIKIRQYFCTPQTLWDHLLNGEVDFAITPIPFESPFIELESLVDEEILVAVSERHPLYGTEYADLSEFRNDKFLVNEASFDSSLVKILCESVGFTPNILISSNESSVITEAMNSGMGVMLMPVFEAMRQVGGAKAPGGEPENIERDALLSMHFPSRTNIKFVRLKDGRMRRTISIARPKDKRLSYAAQCLYEHCQEHLLDLVDNTEKYIADNYKTHSFSAHCRIPMYFGDPAELDSLVLRNVNSDEDTLL